MSHSGSEPSELLRENISGVSSTKRVGDSVRADAEPDAGWVTGSDANVTALEPVSGRSKLKVTKLHMDYEGRA